MEVICAGLWISSNHQQEPEEASASASEAHMMILMVLLQVGLQPGISVGAEDGGELQERVSCVKKRV